MSSNNFQKRLDEAYAAYIKAVMHMTIKWWRLTPRESMARWSKAAKLNLAKHIYTLMLVLVIQVDWESIRAWQPKVKVVEENGVVRIVEVQ